MVRRRQHATAVGEVRQAIAAATSTRSTWSRHWRAPFRGDPRAVGAALAPLDAAWSAAMHEPGWSIVSATPELFLRTRGDRVETMPIKGTRPADAVDRIADSPKDRAEHVMIVDLERNDLGRVCRPGSVRVSAFLEERPMAGVRHMVSTVEGRLRKDVGLAELLRATFPGGSITGAPKIAAIDQIARLEPVGRGASMGALGRRPPERRPRPGSDHSYARDRRRFHPSLGRAAASSGTPTRWPRSRSRWSRPGRWPRLLGSAIG